MILKIILEVIEDYLYVASYGIPLLWALGLLESSFWVWVLIMITHSLTKNTLRVLNEK